MITRRFVYACSLCLIAVNAYAESDVAEHLIAYEAACQALASYDIEMHLVTVPHGEDRRIEQTIRQWFSEGRFRCDQSKDRDKAFGPRQKAWIWNGSQEAVIAAYNNQVILDVKPSGGERTSVIFWQALFREFFPGRSYASLIRNREKATVTQQDGKTVILGPPTDRPGVDFGNIGFRLVLDNDRGLMPVRLEQLLSRDGELRLWTLYVNELQDVGDGVWVPVRSQRTIYDVNEPNESKVLAVTEITLDRDKCHFNTSIDADVFEIGSFPDGTVVTDKATRTIAIVGQKDSEKNMTRLVDEGRIAVDQYRQSRDLMTPTTQWQRRRTWLIALNAGFLVAIIAAVVVLKLRKGRK